MSLYDELLANAAVENCHPKFIARVDGKNVVIADCIGDEAYLTEDGKAFLESQKTASVEEPVVEEAKPVAKRGKKAESADPVEDLLAD